MFFLSIFLLKFLMTLARAICVRYGTARGHTTYGLEMRVLVEVPHLYISSVI